MYENSTKIRLQHFANLKNNLPIRRCKMFPKEKKNNDYITAGICICKKCTDWLKRWVEAQLAQYLS